MHAITGKTTLSVGGETRTLACDMNCAAALFEAKGENWQDWLVERFLGQSIELEGGIKGRRLPPLSPADTVTTLYALLASDREDSSRIESEASLRRSLGFADLAGVQLSIVRAVLTGFGVPGEFIEAVAKAADGPREKRAAKGGTGTRL